MPNDALNPKIDDSQQRQLGEQLGAQILHNEYVRLMKHGKVRFRYIEI